MFKKSIRKIKAKKIDFIKYDREGALVKCNYFTIPDVRKLDAIEMYASQTLITLFLCMNENYTLEGEDLLEFFDIEHYSHKTFWEKLRALETCGYIEVEYD